VQASDLGGSISSMTLEESSRHDPNTPSGPGVVCPDGSHQASWDWADAEFLVVWCNKHCVCGYRYGHGLVPIVAEDDEALAGRKVEVFSGGDPDRLVDVAGLGCDVRSAFKRWAIGEGLLEERWMWAVPWDDGGGGGMRRLYASQAEAYQALWERQGGLPTTAGLISVVDTRATAWLEELAREHGDVSEADAIVRAFAIAHGYGGVAWA
jgi:hypothetical protein